MRPRGRSFGSPDHPRHGAGRPPGASNKQRLEMTAWLKYLADEPDVRDAIRAKVLTDPTMMRELLVRTLGKVPDIVHLGTPAPLVIDLVTGPTETPDE